MAVILLALVGCGGTLDRIRYSIEVKHEVPDRYGEENRSLPGSKLFRIPVVAAVSEHSFRVPPGSRIVVTDLAGPCSEEIRDALMHRLVENANYDVLTRDYLRQIVDEAEEGREGYFDTRHVVRLGHLLGASYFIVGKVIYCGPINRKRGDSDPERHYSLTAFVQILDLKTGKIAASTAGEGKYVPTRGSLLPAAEYDLVEQHTSARVEAKVESGGDSGSGKSGFFAMFGKNTKEKPRKERVNLPALRAAEDFAHRFADRFFSRPIWEDLEMWTHPDWHYGDSVRYVKLGHCDRAVELLESIGEQELSLMSEAHVARYLHNFGVALLCSNRSEEGMNKLRSSYRIAYAETTKRMLDMAGRIQEWGLKIQIDAEPEVDLLLDRLPDPPEIYDSATGLGEPGLPASPRPRTDH